MQYGTQVMKLSVWLCFVCSICSFTSAEIRSPYNNIFNLGLAASGISNSSAMFLFSPEQASIMR